MKKLIFAIIVFGLVGVSWYFYHSHKSRAVILPTITVKKSTIVEEAEAVGYIKPRHSITIKSQIDGTVATIYRDEGDFVKQGEALIKIKPAPSPVEYATAHQQLNTAIEQEQSAKKDVVRYNHALKVGLIQSNYSAYIAAKKAYDTAKLARVLAAQKLALLEVGKTTVAGKSIANIVRSPINGYVLDRIVDVGDPVISLSSAQTSTPLFTVANMNDLMFEGTVDEIDASKIHVDMQAVITVGALPGKTLTGVLNKISLQSEKENLTVSQGAKNKLDSPFNVGFKVEIANLKFAKDLKLRSGYSATAKIKVKTAQDVLTLPLRVIHFDDEKTYVLLQNGKAQKPKKQFVEMGLSDNVNVEIKKGLSLGQKVLDIAEENGKLAQERAERDRRSKR